MQKMNFLKAFCSFAIKMYTLASPQMLYGGTQKCAVSLANHARAVADVIRYSSALRGCLLVGEAYKIEGLLIASTLLVVKAENINWNTTKMHKMMETEFNYLTTFLEALLIAIKLCTVFTTQKCAVPLANHPRAVAGAFGRLPFEGLSTLLNNER